MASDGGKQGCGFIILLIAGLWILDAGGTALRGIHTYYVFALLAAVLIVVCIAAFILRR